MPKKYILEDTGEETKGLANPPLPIDSIDPKKNLAEELKRISDAYLEDRLNRNDVIKNYAFDMYPDYTYRGIDGINYRPNDVGLIAFTNTPNLLVLDAHGGGTVGDKSIYPDPKTIPSNITNNFGYSIQQIANKLGPATNDIKTVVDARCYGGQCDFEDWHKSLPNLQTLVRGGKDKIMTALTFDSLDPNYNKDVRIRRPELFTNNASFNPFQLITKTSTNVIDTLPYSFFLGNPYK